MLWCCRLCPSVSVNGFHAITEVVVDGSFWILNTMISSIFYSFRDKLDWKRQKSAHFQNLKVYFHPFSMPICKMIFWMHGLPMNHKKIGVYYFKKGSNGARIMKFCVFRVHIDFLFFIQFWWGFFLWIYWTVKYGQVCDHQSNIQTDHIDHPEMIMKWHRQYHMYNINLNRYQFTVVCYPRIYIPQYTLRIPVSFPFSSVFSMLGKYEQYFFYKSMWKTVLQYFNSSSTRGIFLLHTFAMEENTNLMYGLQYLRQVCSFLWALQFLYF